MKIDSHQHFWKYDPVRYSWIDDTMTGIRRDFLPSDLQPVFSKNKIDGCIAVQADQSEAETEFLLKLATQFPFIKGVIGWIDLTAENAEERLKYFAENPLFKGIRHTLWDKKGEFMLSPDFQRGISFLKKYNLTYDILAFHYQLESAVKLIENFPDQKFVLDHLGKPDFSKKPSAAWIFQIEKMGTFPTVFCKISGMFSEAANSEVKKEKVFAHFDVLVANFGIKRLIWGSDWPMCKISGSYEAAQSVVEEYFSAFSVNEKLNIFGGNATDFYNLKK